MEKKSRLGRGLDALISGSGARTARQRPVAGVGGSDRAKPLPAAQGLRRRRAVVAQRQHQDARRLAAAGGAAGRRPLSARGRRTAAAGGAGGRVGVGAGHGRELQRPGGARGGADREHPAVRPEPDRKGARLQGLSRPLPHDARAAGHASGTGPADDHEPGGPAGTAAGIAERRARRPVDDRPCQDAQGHHRPGAPDAGEQGDHRPRSVRPCDGGVRQAERGREAGGRGRGQTATASRTRRRRTT